MNDCYYVAQSSNLSLLVTDVQAMIRKGWIPTGGIDASGDVAFYQALWRPSGVFTSQPDKAKAKLKAKTKVKV